MRVSAAMLSLYAAKVAGQSTCHSIKSAYQVNAKSTLSQAPLPTCAGRNVLLKRFFHLQLIAVYFTTGCAAMRST